MTCESIYIQIDTFCWRWQDVRTHNHPRHGEILEVDDDEKTEEEAEKEEGEEEDDDKLM